MDRNRRFILFELNEVPLRVVRHFAQAHPRSAFARILARGCRWDTVTPDRGHLSPWITWPTLHRGVSSDQHHIVALGQDITKVDAIYPPIWQILTQAGRRVGMFGSLHSYPPPEDQSHYDFYVPDTFAAGPEAFPIELSAFQRFNLQMVDRSGRNVSSEVPAKEAVNFLLQAIPAGLRPASLAKIFQQVASERVWRHRSVRRRTIQSILAFDLFIAQTKRKRPHAAFFFTNHVASAMHRYWPATFTRDYQTTHWDPAWVRRFSGELDYAMGEADQMLAELMQFADQNPEYLILVAGSMGQAAVDDSNRIVKSEVLVRDMGKFMTQLGVNGTWQRRRTMEPTYTLTFEDADTADHFLDEIATLRIADHHVPSRRLDPHGAEFILGQGNIKKDDLTVMIGNRQIDPEEIGIANVPIEDEVGAAAYHVPEGMLITYDPSHSLGAGAAAVPVSTTRIAPTLLCLQGLAPEPYMDTPLDDLLVGELKTV